jgi:N-acetylmuramic acid 6-phosphate etherase
MRRRGVSASVPPTEASNARSAGLDRLSTPQLVELLIAEQRYAVNAVLAQHGAIARAVDEIAARLARGGTLHYVGAGSSGRIATLDAAEMPPTFGTPPELVRAHVAGGVAALVHSVEGAEDDGAAGDSAIAHCVTAGDAVVGISASGGAAFAVAAVMRANVLGAYTLALTSVPGSPLAHAARTSIVLDTGAEVLTGSTRLKAGTAQKIALNAISTAVMVRLGKVHDNLMVDLVAANEKLRRRACRLVCSLAGVDERRAGELLERADGRVKVAIVMERRGVNAAQARALLEQHRGSLRAVL